MKENFFYARILTLVFNPNLNPKNSELYIDSTIQFKK